MLQKFGVYQLSLVVYPIIYKVFVHPRWLFGISEPSTVIKKTIGGFFMLKSPTFFRFGS